MHTEANWTSVLTALPPVGEWVLTLSDARINIQTSFIREMYNQPQITIQPAQLRSIDSEGWADWEQLRMSDGGPFRTVRDVTMWAPLPAIPFFYLTSDEYKLEQGIDSDCDVDIGIPQ